MTLAAGKRLGSYEILALIGVGGMGEVYRARDTRLDRTVAIKILPDHVANDADFRQRFAREARTISSLNHPHICTLYDVGNENGIDFLVMELLEGETLTQRLAKGPLPFPQVLRYSIEIAEALDRAHRHGVTHRDLKPGNVMVTKAGAKLLDFGLAKLSSAAAATARDPFTATGTIIGTLQYMAPEQVEGNVADHRADVFAFGAIAYEMARNVPALCQAMRMKSAHNGALCDRQVRDPYIAAMATEGEVLSRPFLGVVAAEPNWDSVYAEQLPRVYNFFRYRIGNDAHAEDLTSRTFEKAWAARSRYRRDLAGFSTWLITIARNVATDHLRAQRPHLPLEAAEDVAAKGTPHDDVANESDLARLSLLLTKLPQREQELVALKYGAEATNRAIAELTGLSESNVGTILHRVVQALRRDW